MLVSKVLHVCEAKGFPSCANTFARRNPVSLNQFSIELFRIFSLRDSTRNVKHVAPCQVSNSKLLDEPLNTRRLTSVMHLSRGPKGEGLFGRPIPRKPKSL